MFKPIEQLVVPVVDALTGLQVQMPRPNSNGERDLKKRIYEVSPMKLWPDVKVIIVDWTSTMKGITKTIVKEIELAKQRKEKPPNFREQYQTRLLEAVKNPIHFDGVDYYGYFGWGSSVKRYQTIGLDHDFGRESGLAQTCEDGSRYLRAFLPSSLYGGGMLNSARILVLKDRATFKGYKIADGCGLVKQSIHDALRNDAPSILLGEGRQSYLAWMRYPWEKIKEEAKKLILAHLSTVGTPKWVLRKMDENAGGYKRKLEALDADMIKHPYLALEANVSIKDMMTEIGTTVPITTNVRIAVPTTVDTVVWEGDTKLICGRHPMDSWQSQMAIEVDTSLEGYAEQRERIARYVAIQYSATSKRESLKGLLIVVPDEIMGEYDLVVSEEDFKMLAFEKLSKYRDGKQKVRVCKDLVLAFTQAYEPGCCFGIDPEMWKSQGGDFDGDMGFISPASTIPTIWATAREWLGRDKTWKVKKTTSPLDERPEMLVQVFGNLVGFATNVVSGTFVTQPDDRQDFADLLFSIRGITAPTIEYLDMWCNKIIKRMTDMFKRRIPIEADHATLRKFQQQLSTEYGGSCSWAIWGQEESPAFVNFVPMFYDQLSADTLMLLETDKDARRDFKYRIHIHPKQYWATCAEIYKIVQPWILEQYRRTPNEEIAYSFLELLDYLPGSHFVGWAPHVSDLHLNEGLEMVREFAAQSRMVYWNSSEDTLAFKATWQQMCETWALKFPTREEAVYTLWRAAHHATVSGSSGASVFMGFPEDCLGIVENKPGLDEQKKEGLVALLVGVDYNFNGNAPDLFGPVSCTVLDVPWRGDMRTILVLDEPLPSMKASQDFPPGTVGMCAQELRESGKFYTNPEFGPYVARLERNKSGKSYRAYLTSAWSTDDAPDGVTLS